VNITYPSIRTDVDRAAYDGIKDAVNWSKLKWFGRTPLHFRHYLNEPPDDTDDMKVGRCLHIGVFEPERYESAVVVWDGGRRAGKDWEAFKALHAGKEILTENERDLVLGMQGAVLSHPDALPLITGGHAEPSVFWKTRRGPVGGLPGYQTQCRGRLDYLRPDGITDLKSTRDASPSVFERLSWNLQYHAQAGFYVDGVEQARGDRPPYWIIAVEKKPPFAVCVYEVPERLLRMGRETYRGYLDQLDFCRREKSWPGYSTGPLQLGIPRWAGGDDEDDDLGDVPAFAEGA
jgi:hypothetical protein